MVISIKRVVGNKGRVTLRVLAELSGYETDSGSLAVGWRWIGGRGKGLVKGWGGGLVEALD
jgi:hypothetical protein